MTTPAVAGAQRLAVPASPLGPRRADRPAARPGLHPVGRVALRATADAIAGHLCGTKVPLRLVTEPAGPNAKTDPRRATGRPARTIQAQAPTGADRDPRTEIPTAPAKGPVLAVPAPGIVPAGLLAATRVTLAAGTRDRLLAVVRIGLPTAEMARPRGMPGRERRETAVTTAVAIAALSARHGRLAAAMATGRRNAWAAGDRGPGRTSGAGGRPPAARLRRTSRVRAARMCRIRSAPISSIPRPGPS
jgi:hypothetical protein